MKKIKTKVTHTYEFEVLFKLNHPDQDPEECLGALLENGCDDATPGIGRKGYILLNFDREAETALEAVSSAIRDAQNALPDAELVEVGPDLVGVTDLAFLLEQTRQNVRHLMQVHSHTLPDPVKSGSGQTSADVWHLSELLHWLAGFRDVNPLLKEVSQVTHLVNVQYAILRLSKTIQSAHLEKAQALVQGLHQHQRDFVTA